MSPPKVIVNCSSLVFSEGITIEDDWSTFLTVWVHFPRWSTCLWSVYNWFRWLNHTLFVRFSQGVYINTPHNSFFHWNGAKEILFLRLGSISAQVTLVTFDWIVFCKLPVLFMTVNDKGTLFACNHLEYESTTNGFALTSSTCLCVALGMSFVLEVHPFCQGFWNDWDVSYLYPSMPCW